MGESSCRIADELVLVPPRRHRLKLASPGRYSLCRSTRPGCEQRSAPAGSMGESSCCTADELVLVPPRRHRLKLASPGRYSLCRSTRPGCEQRSAPCWLDGRALLLHRGRAGAVLPGIAPAVVGVARVRYTPVTV